MQKRMIIEKSANNKTYFISRNMAIKQDKPNPEESLYEHRIVVCFEQIKIKIDESAECKIRYKYSLFGSV